MNKTLRSLFTMVQIGIIVFAVLLSMVRIGVPHIIGYESHIDAWFKKQGIQAKFSHISLSIERLTPKILINGLSINDVEGGALLTLNRAAFDINIWQSLLTQNIIIDQADLFLSKAVLNAKLLDQASNDANKPLLSPQLIQSLLAFKRFTLKIDELDIVDQSQRYVINDSVFTLTGKDDIRHLTLTSALLQQKEIQLKGQVTIDFSQFLADSMVSGSGFIALSIPSLRLANIPKKIDAKGRLFIKNWVHFNGADWSVKTHLNAQNLSFFVAKVKHNLEIDSVIDMHVENGLASASLSNKILSLNKIDFKEMRVIGQTSINDNVNHSSAWFVENIALEKLQQTIELLPQLKNINATLIKLKPKGELKSLLVQIPDSNQLAQSTMRLRVKDVQWSAFKGIPSVDKITLDVVASEERFNAQVRSSGLKVHLADFYSDAFKVDRLTTAVNGQMNEEGLLLDASDIDVHINEASMQGRLSLNIPNKVSPHMFLRLRANNASIQTVMPFLPQILMDKDVLNWVKQSVKKAQVTTADVLYFGRLENDVNFDVKNNGVFETTLNIENIDLHYDAEWPSLQSQQIDLTFKNYQLFSASQLANVQGLKATDLTFTITDLNIPQASLSLNVNDQLEKQWGFLKKSPIKSEIPYFSNVEKIKGYAKTHINASFPLANDTSFGVKFNVDIETDKAAFEVDNLDVSVSDLSANLNITEDKISMKPAPAKWFNQAVNLEIVNKKGATHIKMKGNDMDISSLLNNLPSNVKKHFSGKSAWDVNAVINRFSDDNKPVVSIEAHSGLKGTAIHLPPPFSLSEADTRYLNIKVDVYRSDNLQVRVSLDKILDARLSLARNEEEQYDVLGGRIMFGKSLIAKGTPLKLHIAGNIDDLNIDHWNAYLATDDVVNAESSMQQYLELIERVDLTINQLVASRISAKKIKLIMTKSEKGLQGTLQSSVANGRFFIPVQQSKNTSIDIDFDNVDIILKEGSEGSSDIDYKTNDIPNVVFKSKRFSINGKHFTNAQVEIESHIENQFELKKLSIQHKDIKLKASGQWVFYNSLKEQMSYLKIDVEGKKFGQSLSELGIGHAIENGEIKFSANLTWPDAFWSLDFANAKGKAKLHLSDGYLLDIEPGEGRFVGLLSLSALPRRLTLDFSDFFKEGLEFDDIKGDFLIHDGSMWTTNLKMSGSVSDVNIVGRTGLKEKDYDQIITIIPQVRDALPVLGSLVAGSTVGWAMLLFQRLFKDPIDDSVSIKYKVTGHWDAPKIDLIEKPVPKNTEEAEDPEF